MIKAVVFDLDGVLVDSESIWDQARKDVVAEHGGAWKDGATEAMMGMSSPEWSAYLRDELGVDLEPQAINDAVVERLEQRYREDVPLIDGATEAVERIAAAYPLGLASSSNRAIIDLVLELSGLRFAVTVSSEEVDKGKPAPDVYLAAVEQLGVNAGDAAAIEDSSNGLRSAAAAGLHVVAIPHPDHPPADDAKAQATTVLESIQELTPQLIASLAA
jgi:HAD superfamily hydrolase (TIGR01509 family)